MFGLPVFGGGLGMTGWLGIFGYLLSNMAGQENICDFKGCGKKFKKLQRLIEHKRTHTGEVRLDDVVLIRDCVLWLWNMEGFSIVHVEL